MATSFIHNISMVLIIFLFLWFSYIEASELNSSVHNDDSDSTDQNSITSEQYRTAYHFQPLQHWINDPNGPMYYNGIYHLFYQYNPHAAVWGNNITWGHTISTDLVHWTGLEPALLPSAPFDVNGCWSGSATILPGNKPVIIYTGMDTINRQVQNIAFPKNLSDPYLREWIKPDYNPIIEPVDGLVVNQFRDPTTAWVGLDGQWRIAVGAEIGLKGRAMLYKSQDFVHWVRANSPLYSTNGSRMWECPDFYILSEGEVKKHVLKMSLGETQSDHYMLGRYDEINDVFVPDKNVVDDYHMWKRYDYGNFYASKTFFDEAKQRRILWGWSNESDSVTDDMAKGWSGIQTFPRVVNLDIDGGQLVQWPIEEIESLRRKQVMWKNVELKTGSMVEIEGITGSEADIEVEFELPSLMLANLFDASLILDPSKLCGENSNYTNAGIGPFGLFVLASNNLEEHTAISYTVYKYDDSYKVLICSDQRRSSLRAEVYKPTYGAFVDIDIKKDRKISLRTLIDHSVIESFGGGGRACITSRVYPTLLFKGNAHTYAFNNGNGTVNVSELKAWCMAKCKIS